MKKKITFFIVLVFLTGIFVHNSYAQLTGIKTIPGNYATITAAITDLNTVGVGSGGVTFNVAAGFTETASNLVITATGTFANQIIFQKSGSGANPLITAGVGVGTLDGIILLSGADYITFDGIDLLDPTTNTTTTTQMEWGYAFLKVDGTNGSQFNTIRNCTVTLQKINTASYGIYSANHTTAATTALTVTAFTGTNSANSFYSNTIQNCYSGIWMGGYADATIPYAYYDHYNQIGAQGGNTIRYFGGSSTATYGIYTIYQDSLAISNNNIAGGTGTTTTQYGIMISTANNASVLVYNNTISDTTSTTTSATYGISLNNAGVNGTDNTVIVKRNTVQGMTSTAITSGILYGMYIYYTTAINIYVDSNKFINNKWGGTTQTATGTIYGFYIYPYTTAPVTGSVQYITNNYIAGNKRTQSVIGAGTLYGMYIYYGNQTVNAYNNIIENDSLAVTTSTQYYMYVYNYYATTVNYYNNAIRNIYKGNGSTGTLYGFYISNAAYTGTFNFYNNTANNFIGAGAASGAMYGIYNSSTAVTKNFYGNSAYSIYTNLAGSVYGIYSSGGTTVNIYKNSVYDLRTSTGYGYGMSIASGTTVNAYNNYISDIRSDSISNTLALMGLYISGGTTVNAYYNTVYLNSVSTGTLFGTAALYASSTPTVDLRNNIIVNMSTPGATGGYSTAYYRSSSTLTTYSSLSNNNDFYSGTPDTSHIIYYDGTNYMRTMSSYKTFVSPRDANSVSENPPFVNVSVRPYNLHLNAATPTQCEGSGTVVSAPIAITDDFDGQPRYPNSGYPVNPSYPPNAPDMGADEIGGIPVDLTPPTVTYTPLLHTPLTTARTLIATITDGTGVPTSGLGLPVLYWKINAGSYSSATATSLGSNQYSFTFGSGVVTGDIVSYYICAQDIVVPPNVGATPSSGAGGFTASPPAASIPPTTPSSYTISASALTGDYTVGATLFNKITGRNITFQKVVTKVMREVWIEEKIEKKPLGKGEKEISETSTSVNPKGRKELREVEEIQWVPMENGKRYEGNLYIKKSESPNYPYPMGVNGIYATLTAAIADLNLRGVSGPTRFLLNDTLYSTGETFPLIVNVGNENKPTLTNTVTIKPNTGVTSVISGASAGSYIFRIYNSYVIIDGSNTVSGTTRNLTIQNTSTTTPTVLTISSIGTTPITNVTLKNSNIINGITSSSAVVIRDSSALAGYFNNITIQNNSIQQAYIGLYCNAVMATGNGSGLLITGNDLNTVQPLNVRLTKIYVQGVDGATVSNNNIGNDSNGTDASNITGIWFATGTVNSTISNNNITNIYGYGPPRGIAISSAVPNANINITGNTITGLKTAYSSPPYGIYVFSTTSAVSVTKNRIGNMLNTATGGYGARGINIATSTTPANIDIINNFVWNIVATADASVTYWGIGIAIDATISNVNVYANSVNLYGTYAGYSSATVHTAFYNAAGVTALNVRDNIFVNSYDNTNSTTDISYAIYSASANTAYTDINYCDYYVSGTPGVLGYLGGQQATLAAWRTATGKDLNSVSGNPMFISDNNLHIDSTASSPVNNSGQFIATVTNDIDGQLRSTTTPDIGADEYTYQQGPLSGIKYIPGDYASIPLAITDLNAWGVGTGGVTFRVAANKVDTAVNLVINTTGTTSNPITFEKWGSGANPVLIAGVGVGALDGFIALNGADYITFDGIDLMENSANTTTTAQMEIGYALLKVDGTNGSQNNTIKNCSITLNKTNPSTVGIYAANHTISSTTGLTVTAISGTNSNNKFFNNSIQNCYSGIYVLGFADATPYVFYDNGNDVGSLGGNTVRNFGGGATTTYGIYTTYQDSLAVSNNNVGGGTGSTAISYGIYIYYGYNANALIYNNTVSDTTASLTSTTYGIAVYYVGNTGVDNTVIVKRNTVQGMTNTAAATSAALYGYYIYYTTSYNLYIDSNRFVNNKWGNTSGTFTGAIYPFYNYTYTTAPTAGSTEYITNNYIAGNKRIQSVIGTGSHYGMYNYYGLANLNSYNNVVENDTMTTTSTNYGIYMYHYYSTTANIYNNSVRNIYKIDGSTGSYYGIYLSNAAYTGTCNYYNNSVYNIKCGVSTAPLYGQYLAATSVTKNVYGNTVYNLWATTSGSVYGIYQSGGTTVSLYKNRVYNLRTATGSAYGIYVASGTTNNIYNNYISDIRADSSITAMGVTGLYISGGTTDNVYYNSIYLNSVSAGTTFGTAALYASTTPTVDLRNNIIVNMSTPGTTSGMSVAYWRSSSTLTTYSDSSNRNCFYSGTPSANRLIYYDGTNSDSTIAQFKTRVAPKDANSFSENPPFVNISTPPYNLHLQTTIPTLCEGNARPITAPAITDDYDGDTRNTTTPDVGADEGNFTPLASTLSLNLKVYLEGFWNGTTQVPDTVMVYLANATSPYAFADTAKIVLGTAGTSSMQFSRASGGSYYIVINHRNHLETYSRLPQTFVPGTPLSYDFTTDSAKAYGFNMKKSGSVWVLYGGDPNRDGSIDGVDISIFIAQFGLQGYLSCDFDGDGDVTASDVQIIAANFGLTKSVPSVEYIEPGKKIERIKIEDALKEVNRGKEKGVNDRKIENKNNVKSGKN